MRHNVTPGLAAVRADQIERLRAQCRKTILGGYRSAALGREHVYPSQLEDQANMSDSVLSSFMVGVDADWRTPFACVAPENQHEDEWPWLDHSAEQIRQAGMDGKAFILQQRQLLRGLIGQVKDAASETEVLAIRWPES